MARPRLARKKLEERYGGQTPGAGGGYAYAKLAGGKEIYMPGDWASWGGETSPGPRPAQVAGYKKQRERQIASRERAAATLRARGTPRETPAQMLSRRYGMDPSEAYSYVRQPGLRELIGQKIKHGQRLEELERTAGYRAGLQGIKGQTAHDLLGRRLGAATDIAGKRELGRQKRAIDMLGQRGKELASREKVAGERAEATAEGAAGKAAESRRAAGTERTEKERIRLEDRVNKLQDRLADAAAAVTVEGRRAKGAIEKQLAAAQKRLDDFNATQPGEEAPSAEDETVTPKMLPAPEGQPSETITPQMMKPDAPVQYRTAAELISAIKNGAVDMTSPESGAAFDSLDPQAQDEVRAWLKRNGYLQ